MLSLLLLIGAGFVHPELDELERSGPRVSHLESDLTFRVDPTLNGYKPERSLEFYRQLQQNLDAIPGVESASAAVVPILAGNEWDNSIAVEGYQPKVGEFIDPHMNYIEPDYFMTLNVPILQGRDFEPRMRAALRRFVSSMRNSPGNISPTASP